MYFHSKYLYLKLETILFLTFESARRARTASRRSSIRVADCKRSHRRSIFKYTNVITCVYVMIIFVSQRQGKLHSLIERR